MTDVCVYQKTSELNYDVPQIKRPQKAKGRVETLSETFGSLTRPPLAEEALHEMKSLRVTRLDFCKAACDSVHARSEVGPAIFISTSY